ncbi:MAG: putative sugar nucleotidyl transferase [Spirochaetes bacterium]|nr:putative sugar nucleotidyl transferase [Spirochaetota bacterium]
MQKSDRNIDSIKRIVVCNTDARNFYPISQTRPVWDILCGHMHLWQRIAAIADRDCPNAEIIYLCPENMIELFREKYPDLQIEVGVTESIDTLFINPFLTCFSLIFKFETNTVLTFQGTFLAAIITKDYSSNFSENLDNLKTLKTLGNENININSIETEECSVPRFIWDIVAKNGDYLNSDFEFRCPVENVHDTVKVNYHLLGSSDRCIIEPDVTIDPFTVIDTRSGTVYISEGTHIHSFTRIEGPAFIGRNVTILGAKVREGCSIGESCRVGGEVEDSIFHSFSNKYHDGFIGHAYIGEYVNLGALTTNSDLKNDYSFVSVYNNNSSVNTGLIKVGCYIGDHTKMSIGSLINTGTHIGCCSMSVHSGRMTPKYIPSFSVFIKNSLRQIKDISELIYSIKKIMKRRNKEMSSLFEKYIVNLYEETAQKRDGEIEVWNKTLR